MKRTKQALVKDRAPKVKGRRVLNMAPHDPKEVIVVGDVTVEENLGRPRKLTTSDLAAIANPKPLKTKLKPRGPKRKRTVVPSVPSKPKAPIHVERTKEEQVGMDAVEEAANIVALDDADRKGMGRPTLYLPNFPGIVRVMCQGGATDREMADALGVTDRTFQRWKHVYPDFCQALAMGKGAPDDRVERSLFQRAVGYSFEKTEIGWFQGRPTMITVIEHVPPDPKAAQYWLNNRRSKKWRNRQELTGANGKDLVPKTKHTMSRAELEAIAVQGRKGK